MDNYAANKEDLIQSIAEKLTRVLTDDEQLHNSKFYPADLRDIRRKAIVLAGEDFEEGVEESPEDLCAGYFQFWFNQWGKYSI